MAMRRPFVLPGQATGQPPNPAMPGPAGMSGMMRGPQRAPMTGAPMGGPDAGRGGPSGAPGGAGITVPPPPIQPQAGGPTAPGNVLGSPMLQPRGPMGGPMGAPMGGGPSGPPQRQPLPPWGDSQGVPGLGTGNAGPGVDDLSAGAGMGAGAGNGAADAASGGTMGPMVMLRLMKALGRI